MLCSPRPPPDEFATHPVTRKIFATRFGFQPHQKDQIFAALVGAETEISYSKWMNSMYDLMKQIDANDGQVREFSVFLKDKKAALEAELEKKFPSSKGKSGKDLTAFKATGLPSHGGKVRMLSSDKLKTEKRNGPVWLYCPFPANPTHPVNKDYVKPVRLSKHDLMKRTKSLPYV